MSAGLSSASFWSSASSLRYSAAASAGLPVFDSRLASAVVALRQGVAEVGDGGVVVGQLLPERHRLAELGLCLRRLARIRQQPAAEVVAVRQVAAEFGDGGVVVGQLLVERQRLAELGLRLRRLARVISRRPRLLWLSARPLRNSVTAGLSSASFWQSASALRNSASASAGLPVSAQQVCRCD